MYRKYLRHLSAKHFPCDTADPLVVKTIRVRKKHVMDWIRNETIKVTTKQTFLKKIICKYYLNDLTFLTLTLKWDGGDDKKGRKVNVLECQNLICRL